MAYIFKTFLLCAIFTITAHAIHAQCTPSEYVKNKSELLEAKYKAGSYDDFDDADISLVNDQLYTTDQEFDNKNTYTIYLVTDPGVKALVLQLNDDHGKKIDFIQSMTTAEKNVLTYTFRIPYEGKYQVQVKVIKTTPAPQCVHLVIMEYDPDKN